MDAMAAWPAQLKRDVLFQMAMNAKLAVSFLVFCGDNPAKI